jgi:triosephosphate isomerase
MHKTSSEALSYVRDFRKLIMQFHDVEIVIAPPFTAIGVVAEAIKGTALEVAGQDLHWEKQGAFTGAISATMLKESGANWVILGHSERRHVFGDSNEAVNRKLSAALTACLKPIVCIGETLDERKNGKTFEVLKRQIAKCLEGLAPEQISTIVLAYEPVWAIGTGQNASPEQAGEVHNFVREHLKEGYGNDSAEGCRIIYGGSVKPENASRLVSQPNVDGVLVGGAGLDPTSFYEIIARTQEAEV